MIKSKFFYTVILVLFMTRLYSQVNIGSESPAEAFSSIQLSEEDRGLRLNQVTEIQRNQLPVNGNPLAIGLMIYNINSKNIEVWNGTSWISLGQTSITVSNGLNINDSDIQLGGMLTKETFLNLNDRKLNLTSSTNVSILSVQNTNIGIGTASPANNAILDISSSNKGVLLPRVTLTSNMDKVTIPNPGKGMLVYNTGTHPSYPFEGFLYWNANEWRNIDGSQTINPKINELICDSPTLEPSSFKAGQYFSGIMKVPYTGGNGGQYGVGDPINSQFNTGLTATLRAGTLEIGNGFLVYDVTGTPSYNSPYPADFSISFNGTNPCTCLVGNVDVAIVSEKATLGPLLATNDNGVSGFHRVVTTPDGKFSVRVFVPTGTVLANADLQIRSNTNSNSIMWNGQYSWQGGSSANASNNLNLATPNMWYGNAGGDAKSVESEESAAWGNADVYFTAPEQRSYMWTSTDVADKTMYILTFMMGAPNPAVKASAETAKDTKAYLEIRQIRTPD